MAVAAAALRRLSRVVVLFMVVAACQSKQASSVPRPEVESASAVAPSETGPAASEPPSETGPAASEPLSETGPVASAPPSAAEAAVLVELFTSEGCSSCPPADRVLADLADGYRGRPLLVLSMHVDYWNDLGWRDPFSSDVFSARQRRYARVLGERGVYTPQMIVDGVHAFVGSRREQAERAIDAAFDEDARTPLAFRTRRRGRTYELLFQTSRANAGAECSAVIFEPSRAMSVPRGENAGRRLVHVNVVRELRSSIVGPDGTATLRLRLPDDVNPDEARVAGWLSDPATLRVLAVATGPRDIARRGTE